MLCNSSGKQIRSYSLQPGSLKYYGMKKICRHKEVYTVQIHLIGLSKKKCSSFQVAPKS